MLLELTENGLYCPPGHFYVDPWRPVGRAILSHAHADHARLGASHYLAAAAGEPLLRYRLGADISLETLPYGEPVSLEGVRVSLHPAGHVLGSAQVRVEHRGEVWVVSGDYKRQPDPTCAPFEVVPCHTFITEATFGLPIYRWPEADEVFAAINRWWLENQAARKASVLFAYALGKAQRILAGIDSNIGPIYVHGAVYQMNKQYAAAGIRLPACGYATEAPKATEWSQALIVAPTSAQNSPWLRRFGPHATAFASGWMRVRGQRRRRSVDRGFVLSDHVDWPNLIATVRATGAQRILVTHGYVAPVVRWLDEQGWEAFAVQTPYRGDEEEAGE